MAKRRKPKTYETTLDGKKVRVTVPEKEDTDVLAEALKDNLSPHAVAAIAAYLQAAIGTNDPDVDKEVNWFREKLVDILCGRKDEQAFNRLCEELGL